MWPLVALLLLALAAEVALQILFWSDPMNFDCGGPCGTRSEIIGAAAFGVVPAAIVLLLVIGGIGLYRRRRRSPRVDT